MSAFNHRLVVIPLAEQAGALCGGCGQRASHYGRMTYLRKGVEVGRERRLCSTHAADWQRQHCNKKREGAA